MTDINQSQNNNTVRDTDIPAAPEERLGSHNIDDVVIESYNDDLLNEDGINDPKEIIKRLKEKLRTCTSEKQEYLDGWQRTKAEFVNYKKKEIEEKGEFIKYAQEDIVTDLIPVLESFHMAFANQEVWEKVDPSWRKGVEYIHTQLVQILFGYGLTEIDPKGEKFDPSVHTSVAVRETTDENLNNSIASVMQLGYRLNGKLLRSPRVEVYQMTSVTEKEKVFGDS